MEPAGEIEPLAVLSVRMDPYFLRRGRTEQMHREGRHDRASVQMMLEVADAFADTVLRRGRQFADQMPLAYRARALNGIWAMAPYLQNGSVPSLYDLLLPPDQRPKTFYVGDWNFDPEIVGYETNEPFPGAFPFDTSTRGNRNTGHEFGTDLSEEDRKALIEYLKTL